MIIVNESLLVISNNRTRNSILPFISQIHFGFMLFQKKIYEKTDFRETRGMIVFEIRHAASSSYIRNPQSLRHCCNGKIEIHWVLDQHSPDIQTSQRRRLRWYEPLNCVTQIAWWWSAFGLNRFAFLVWNPQRNQSSQIYHIFKKKSSYLKNTVIARGLNNKYIHIRLIKNPRWSLFLFQVKSKSWDWSTFLIW